MFSQRFHDRRAVVTGGASGIGRATALRMAREGAGVVIADIDGAAAASTVAEIERGGGQALAVIGDLRDAAQVRSLREQALAFAGRVDILVNCAAKVIARPLLETSVEAWHDIQQVNMDSCFLCCQAFGVGMVGAGYGRIVNVASHSALLGSTGRGAYAASKGGMVAMTRVLAVELAASGVTVNAIAPGVIETPMTAGQSQGRRDEWKRNLPIARCGTAEEVAAAITFLCSEEAAYITGQTLSVDGGFSTAGLMTRA